MRISKDTRKLMTKRQNMTKLGHEVWCEESQNYVKSSLPENPTMKTRECQETESLHKWSVEKQLVCRDTASVEDDECNDRSSGSIEVTAIEISEKPMKTGWDVTGTPIVVKTDQVEEPLERREPCGDDAKEPILGRATDVENIR